VTEGLPVRRFRRSLRFSWRRAGDAGRCLFFVPEAGVPCGVRDYTSKLVSSLRRQPLGEAYEEVPVAPLGIGSAARRILRADTIVFSFPLLAWSRTVLLPILLLLLGSATGRRTVLFLHEWSDLHPLRRATYLPFVALCRTIIMLSPTVKAGFQSDPVVKWASSKCRLALHAPAVLRPATRESSSRVEQVQKFASGCDIVIGYFGSIYRRKEPAVLLEVCRYLRRNHIRASVLFVGGFTNSIDGYESRFLQTVRAMGLEDAVFVTGYVESTPELFALLECADVFLYLFPEGLTTRRSSVLTSVEAGRPVLVPDPACAAEVSHHPGYCSLIRDGAVQLIPREAALPQIADAVVAAARRGPIARPVDFEAWWELAAASVSGVLGFGADSFGGARQPGAAAKPQGPVRPGASRPAGAGQGID
jgi:glycosyltransferase involved in cell wall biosynthesis